MEKKWRGKRARVLKELENNPLVERACKKIGIARSTYSRWCNADIVFKHSAEQAQDKGREKLTDFVESKLLENISNNQYASIAYWLSHNTTRYRPYPKNVYTDEIKRLRLSHRAYEELADILKTEAGYDALKRFISNHKDFVDQESPLDDN